MEVLYENPETLVDVPASSHSLSSGRFSQIRSYPNKQIEIVVPFPPGGTVDVTIRVLSEELSKNLGVPVIVSNKAGGTGSVEQNT